MSQRVLIAGYGVSGRGAARLAAYLKLDYDILDERDSEELRAAETNLHPAPRTVFRNWKTGMALPRYDLIVLSPGIRQTNPLYAELKQHGPLLGELSFALRHTACPVIGITGTNGKTTTTELTCALFNAAGIRSAAAGNIGAALSDSAIDSQEGKLDALIIEISSFQLESMEAIHPHTGAVLNLASDHLDRHGSMHEYARIKFTLLKDPAANVVLNTNLAEEKQEFLGGERKAVTFSAYDQNGDFSFDGTAIRFHGKELFPADMLRLKGRHNLENVMAALALLRSFGGDEAMNKPEVRKALCDFRPDAHRLEVFAEQDGIRYINDSKATNPHSVNAALQTFGGKHDVILLMGGLDKGMDFNEMAVNAEKIRSVYLYGQCADTIYNSLHGMMKCHPVTSFEEAVNRAMDEAETGCTVMLSPATASMDMFKNYRERGDKFKELVLNRLHHKGPGKA